MGRGLEDGGAREECLETLELGENQLEERGGVVMTTVTVTVRQTKYICKRMAYLTDCKHTTHMMFCQFKINNLIKVHILSYM